MRLVRVELKLFNQTKRQFRTGYLKRSFSKSLSEKGSTVQEFLCVLLQKFLV